jgi:hypothetical protein
MIGRYCVELPVRAELMAVGARRVKVCMVYLWKRLRRRETAADTAPAPPMMIALVCSR